MTKLLALLALVIVTVAAKPGSGGGWKVFNTNLSRWTASTAAVQAPDLATPQFTTQSANYTALLTTNYVGDISGKTLTAVFTVSVTSGDPGYIYGLYNFSGYPQGTPHARLYFSKYTGYDNEPSDPLGYWFGSTRVDIDDVLGTVTISCSVQPANWNSTNGRNGAETSIVSSWVSSAQNARAIGLAFGGYFDDVGIATTNGTAVLHFHSFTIQ